MQVAPTGETPSARIEGIDLARPLSDSDFRDMRGAYDELPEARQPLTPEQRAKKPSVSQPIFRRHPSASMVLYANPGYTMFIDGTDPQESGERHVQAMATLDYAALVA